MVKDNSFRRDVNRQHSKKELIIAAETCTEVTIFLIKQLAKERGVSEPELCRQLAAQAKSYRVRKFMELTVSVSEQFAYEV